MKLLFFLVFTNTFHVYVCKPYDGYHEYSVGPLHTHDHIAKLESIRNWDLQKRKVQVLQHHTRLGATYNVIVAPDQTERVTLFLQQSGIPYTLVTHDVQRSHDSMMEENSVRSTLRFSPSPESVGKTFAQGDEPPDFYMTYEQVQTGVVVKLDLWPGHMQIDHMKKLARSSNIAEYSSLGDSFEGREMPLLTINGDRADLPGIWLDAGMHAREWITHATALYIMHKILLDTDSQAASLRNDFRFYIAPNLNPDGYLYTWTSDRYWRKNRNTTSGCGGVDLNRNFNVNFGGCHTSSDPCSDTYKGAHAHSEAESQAVVAMVKHLHSNKGGIELFISMHAAAQMWLVPWAASAERPDDFAQLLDVATAAVDAIRHETGFLFQAGAPPYILYCGAGTLYDWAKNDGTLRGDGAGIKYSFTPELRYGHNFAISPSNIEPSGREIFAALYAAISRIYNDTSRNKATNEETHDTDCTSLEGSPTSFEYDPDSPTKNLTGCLGSSEESKQRNGGGAYAVEMRLCLICFIFSCICPISFF